MTISWEAEPWIDIEEKPIPMRQKVEGLHTDGKTIVVGKCLKIGNAITDDKGCRWPVTHWRWSNP